MEIHASRSLTHAELLPESALLAGRKRLTGGGLSDRLPVACLGVVACGTGGRGRFKAGLRSGGKGALWDGMGRDVREGEGQQGRAVFIVTPALPVE